MMTKKRFNLLILCICLGQVHAITACTFTKRSDEFNAAVKYEILLGSEELCLTACYEESDCAFVEYYQGSCTVYKNGSKVQAGHGNVLEFDRQLSRSCSRRTQISEPAEKFETIASVNSDNRACSGSPNSATAINVFQGRDSLRFYSTDKSILSDGTAPHRRMLFATNHQNHCTSIPVFTRANHRRLYFGSVYNVTGYIFMDAYAFAEPCTCDTNACCGTFAIKEFLLASNSYAYTSTTQLAGKTPSDVDQIFYIINAEII